MKRVLGILIIISGCAYNSLQAQDSASFNFSLASHPVSGWNNISGDPATGVRNATDPSTGISVSSIGPANWAGYNGSAAFDGGGIAAGGFFPGGVMQNMWYQYSAYFSSYNSALPQLIIGGLSTDSIYTIRVTCSFDVTMRNTFNLSPTRYSVAGMSVVGFIDVYGNSNTTGGANFYNISPDSSGNIRIYINTLSSTSVAGISGIRIISGHT